MRLGFEQVARGRAEYRVIIGAEMVGEVRRVSGSTLWQYRCSNGWVGRWSSRRSAALMLLRDGLGI